MFESEDSELKTLTPPRMPTGSFTGSSLSFLRLMSLTLSLSFLGLLIYTVQTDGSPFRSSLLTPWMKTTLIDYYLTLLPTLIWCIYRERGSLLKQVLVSVFLCCLGSFAVWAYILYAVMKLRDGDAVIKILGHP